MDFVHFCIDLHWVSFNKETVLINIVLKMALGPVTCVLVEPSLHHGEPSRELRDRVSWGSWDQQLRHHELVLNLRLLKISTAALIEIQAIRRHGLFIQLLLSPRTFFIITTQILALGLNQTPLAPYIQTLDLALLRFDPLSRRPPDCPLWYGPLNSAAMLADGLQVINNVLKT